MKNYILLFCVVFLILLAGCDGQNKSTNSSAELGSVTDHASAADGEAQVAETRAQASVPPAPVELKVAPEDRNQAWGYPSFVETADGYYFAKYTGQKDMICYCPRGGDTFYPLCSKPNCSHADEDCNASFNGWFGYYEGAIYATDYTASQDFVLIKMNLDGTDHQVVATLSHNEWDCGYSCTFHHGKLYLKYTGSVDLPFEEQQDHLVAVDLSDYSQKEIATEYLQTARLPDFFLYYKDKLYGTGSGDKNPNAGISDYKLIELDAVTGQTRVLLSKDIGSAYVTDTKLYYFEADLSYLSARLGEQIEKSEPGFRELDLNSGAIKDCGLPVEDIKWACYDEDYIYAGNRADKQTIYFLSRDYKLVDQIELPWKGPKPIVTSDRVFFMSSSISPITHYLEKSEIGSHKLTLIPIETVG